MTDAAVKDLAAPIGLAGRIDRTVVQLATGGAIVFFAVLFGNWVAMGDTSFLLQSITPAVLATTGIVMLAVGKPLPLTHLVIGGLGIVFYVAVSDVAPTVDPVVGLLVLSIAGVALAKRWVLVFAAGAAIVLGVAAYSWMPEGTSPADRLVSAFVFVVAFGFTTWLLVFLKRQSMRDRSRLENLVASKDEFIAAVSHELRTPLTAVVGLAEELQERFDDFTRPEVDEFVRLLVAESADVADIVEDLLVAARTDLGSLAMSIEDVDVGDAVDAIAADAPTVTVVWPRGAGRGITVRADALRLRQILRNLVANAVRYGGPGVRVVVAAGGAEVTVEVRDDGPPLRAEERALVFEAYHRTPTAPGRPGSVGLGLTVSQRLARLMGGDVEYDHDGTEAIFRLRLPAASTRLVQLAATGG